MYIGLFGMALQLEAGYQLYKGGNQSSELHDTLSWR